MNGRRVWRDWIVANAVGELCGLGVAGAVAVLAHPTAKGGIGLMAAAFLTIGAYEGVVVGAAQGIVLRRVLPSVCTRSWVLATAAGAVTAWMFACIPAALAGGRGDAAQEEPRLAVMVLLSAGAGVALGAILGFAQWLVLRHRVPRASRWIGANALAWCAGMPLIFIAAGLPGSGWMAPSIAALLLLAVTVAGAVVGAIEGAFLRSLIRTASGLTALPVSAAVRRPRAGTTLRGGRR